MNNSAKVARYHALIAQRHPPNQTSDRSAFFPKPK